MKKYLIKTEYNSGILVEDKETAINILSAIPVKTRGYSDNKWTIDDRKLSLLVIDEKEIIVPKQESEDD